MGNILGFSPNPDEMHFNSKVFDCQNPQDYSFDYNPIYSFNLFSSFPVGTFLCVHLLGKYTRQPGDELFYSCLENVKINGITIGNYHILFFISIENMFGYYDARLVAKTIINYSVDILSKLLKSSSIEKFINLSDSKISSLLISYISDNQSHESWNELESELISQSKLLLSEHLKIDSILKQLKSLIYSGEITEAVDLIILHSNVIIFI